MNKKKILIIGITSIVGYRFYKLNKNFEIFGLCRRWPENKNKNIYEVSDLKINYVQSMIETIKPDVVINCISIGNVDECEIDPTKAEVINHNFAIELINLSRIHNYKLIHFSSSLIYDGTNAPYNENSIAKPLNKYGELKLLTDKYLRDNFDNKNLLLRPTTIYGVKENFQRDNPANFIIQKIMNEQDFMLVDDVITNLLYIDDFIKIIQILIDKNMYGEFNIGGDEPISRYDFGLKIFQLLNNKNLNFKKTSSLDFRCIAERPLNTVLDNFKIKNITNFTFTTMDIALKKIISNTRKT